MVRRLLPVCTIFASAACDGTVIIEETGSGGAPSTTTGSSSDASTSAGPAWTVPPERVFSYVSCADDGGALLFVEVWPSAPSACVPPPRVEEVLVLGVDGWNGQPGTFVVGEETPNGLAMASSGTEPVTGAITIEPFVLTPSVIAWDLSVGSGRTDLGVCGKLDDFPCP